MEEGANPSLLNTEIRVDKKFVVYGKNSTKIAYNDKLIGDP